MDPFALPQAAPAFAAHFTDPLYEDSGNSLAPFGSDEGADTLADWADRRDELGPTSTLADVLEDDPADYLGDDQDVFGPMFVQAAGFTLLRLTGHIDAEGRAALLGALDQLIALQGREPVLLRQREDVASFRDRP